MASLSPPIGGRGRGPLRNGTRIEAAITVSCRLGGFRKDSGRELPMRLHWHLVVYTCRVEMELGFRLKADVILFLFVRYF
jgi:hypothetical protein